MKNLRIAIVTLLALFIGAVLALATEPKLKLPPELKTTGPDLGYYAKPFQGFGEVEKWEEPTIRDSRTVADECTCVDCKCAATKAVSTTSPAMVTRYRTEMRPTGRMVQQCNGSTCSMVPEMVSVSVPYEVDTQSQLPMVSETQLSTVDSWNQTFEPAQSTGLLYNANGRQRLFQPVRRWRLRFQTGKWFPNAWWNR